MTDNAQKNFRHTRKGSKLMICAQCGKEFEPKAKHQRFCGASCRRKADYYKHRKARLLSTNLYKQAHCEQHRLNVKRWRWRQIIS